MINLQELSNITLMQSMRSVMLAESVATLLDGMASFDEALMEAAPLVRNGCDIVACVGTSPDGRPAKYQSRCSRSPYCR